MALGTAWNGFVSGGIKNFFAATAYTGNTSSLDVATDQDMTGGALVIGRPATSLSNNFVVDSERGGSARLITNSDVAENTGTARISSFNANGFTATNSGDFNGSVIPYIAFSWLVEAGFMDIVTYTGNGTTQAVAHNLGVVPKMIWVKRRSGSDSWRVYHVSNTANPETDYLELNNNAGTADNATMWNDTAPTSSNFTVGNDAGVNASGETYVAYVFSDTTGLAKFGSYTGNGTSQSIVTGFTPKAVLVKRTDSTGNWSFAYNNSGIKSIELDNTNAQSDFSASMSFDASGFSLLSANRNVSSASYIYAAWG